MTHSSKEKIRPSFAGALACLVIGALPIVWYLAAQVQHAYARTAVHLPDLSLKPDDIGNWALLCGVLCPALVFPWWDLAGGRAFERKHWVFFGMMAGLPCGLVLLVPVLIPGVPGPEGKTLLMMLGMGFICLATGFGLGVFLEGLGRAKHFGTLVVTGLVASVLVSLPGLWWGKKMVQAQGAFFRRIENESRLKTARSFADDYCRKVVGTNALIDSIEKEVPVREGEFEPVVPSAGMPVLYYRSTPRAWHQDVKVLLELKGLGVPLSPGEEVLWKGIRSPEAFSGRGNFSTDIVKTCGPYRYFDVYPRPKENMKTGGVRLDQGFPGFPEPVDLRDIKTVVRVTAIRDTDVGYYSNGPRAYNTTIDLEVISLAERKIVARKSFLGRPPDLYERGEKTGFADAVQQAREWLESFLKSDSFYVDW